MPIIKSIQTQDEEIYIWKISETLGELTNEYSERVEIDKRLEKIKKNHRKMEYLASRIMLFDTLKKHSISFDSIRRDENGKPSLLNSTKSISITHSNGYAGFLFSNKQNCGIDIECKFDLAFKLKEKFCSEHELSICNHKVIAANLWSAKEALYKAYGSRKLIFDKDLILNQPHFQENLGNSFMLTQTNEVIIQNISTEDFVLNYCFY